MTKCACACMRMTKCACACVRMSKRARVCVCMCVRVWCVRAGICVCVFTRPCVRMYARALESSLRTFLNGDGAFIVVVTVIHKPLHTKLSVGGSRHRTTICVTQLHVVCVDTTYISGQNNLSNPFYPFKVAVYSSSNFSNQMHTNTSAHKHNNWRVNRTRTHACVQYPNAHRNEKTQTQRAHTCIPFHW